MIDKILTHLASKNLDIRIHNIGTFIDQKVTPDVLSAVAECINEYLSSNQEPFTINDIRYADYSNNLVTTVFNKPEIEKAESEYDKFFAQPIKMLSYAGILNENSSGKPHKFSIINKEILDFIASRERNALLFLQEYNLKIIKDSGLYPLFDNFFARQDKQSFEKLKTEYINFVIDNTPKNTAVEVSRIFTKVLNPLSYKFKVLGTRKGNLSDTVISLDELYYNRPNWRDINKDKSLTRVEASALIDDIVENDNLFRYKVDKSKKAVKALHPHSEIHRFKEYPALQAHHIFMESQYPQIADSIENIICLTPNQHFYRAHPMNKTSVIDDNYQAICLISKLDSIEANVRGRLGDYSLEEFINVLNTGFETNYFSIGMDYEEVKHSILKFFNERLKQSYVRA